MEACDRSRRSIVGAIACIFPTIPHRIDYDGSSLGVLESGLCSLLYLLLPLNK